MVLGRNEIDAHDQRVRLGQLEGESKLSEHLLRLSHPVRLRDQTHGHFARGLGSRRAVALQRLSVFAYATIEVSPSSIHESSESVGHEPLPLFGEVDSTLRIDFLHSASEFIDRVTLEGQHDLQILNVL